MTKINVRAANRENAVNCEFEGHPGRLLLITEDVIARHGADEGLSVRPGQMVVSYLDGNVMRGKKLLPQVENDVTLIFRSADGAYDRRVPLRSATDLLNAVRSIETSQDDAPERERSAMGRVADYADYLFATGLDRLGVATPELKTAAYSYQEQRSRRQERAGLTDEQMDLINEARSIREAIGRINPEHPDALVRGGTYASKGRARNVIEENVQLGGGYFDENQRRALTQNRVLTEEVFGKMTETGIFDLYARYITPQDYATLQQEMDPGLVEGGFMDDIRERVGALFARRMPGYQPEMQLYTGGGADYLLVKDHGGHYVYGWDTDSRKVAAPDDKFAVLGAGDVPEPEEIERLRAALDDIRYDNGNDILFAEFGAAMAFGDEGQDFVINDYDNDDDYDDDYDDEDDYRPDY